MERFLLWGGYFFRWPDVSRVRPARQLQIVLMRTQTQTIKSNFFNFIMFRVILFNALWNFLGLGNLAWKFFGDNVLSRDFSGFDFCRHSIIHVTCNSQYPPPPPTPASPVSVVQSTNDFFPYYLELRELRIRIELGRWDDELDNLRVN